LNEPWKWKVTGNEHKPSTVTVMSSEMICVSFVFAVAGVTASVLRQKFLDIGS